jgi:hypothetical protein
MNLLNLHLWGGRRVVPALEADRVGTEVHGDPLRADPQLDLATASFDFEQPRCGALPGGNAHVLVFTSTA